MSFFEVLAQMLSLFFAMLCGYTAHKVRYLDAAGEGQISALLLNVLLPCLILGSVLTGDFPERSAILAFLGISVLYFGLEGVFLLTVPRLLPGSAAEKGAWRYMLFFANTAYVGYPVVLSLYGREGLFYAVALCIPFNLLCYSLGPLLLSGARHLDLRSLRSPGLLASAAALILALARLRPPLWIGETLSFVGDIAVPLSMVLLGSLLAGLPARRIFSSPVLWILSAVRLLLMPTVLALILRALDVPPLMLGVAVMEMGMPAAVNGSMMCLGYGGDADTMSALIFLSTLASILTIPVIAAVLL